MTHPSPTFPDMAPLESAVLVRHGLRKQPFAPGATNRFVYGDPALDMPVGVLLQRLQTDDKPLMLVGEHGVGKSTQLVQLLSRGAAALTFCAFKGRPGATFASIEHAIRQQWGKAATGTPASESNGDGTATQTPEKNSLAMILLSVAKGERRPVLVIDDAHLLAPAVLGALLRLRREVNRHSENTLGIVLAGEPVLSDLVVNADGPGMPVEPFGVIRLRPLMESQTEAYLRHRLQAAGAKDAGLFSGEIVHAIQTESGGLPAEINRIANRHLEELVPEETTGTADARSDNLVAEAAERRSYWIVPAAAGAFGVLIGALVASLFFLADDRIAQTDPLPPEQQVEAGGTPPEPASIASDSATPAFPEREPVVALPISGVPLPEPVIPSLADASEDPGSTPEQARDSARAPLDEPERSPETSQPVTPSQQPEPATTLAVGSAPAVAEESAVAGESEAEETAVPEAAPAQRTDVNADAEQAEQTGAGASGDPAAETPAEPARADAPKAPRGPDWVRERPAGQFTIQIIAGPDLDALHRFARRVSMEADVAWFRTRRGEQDWYALVTGEYPDLATAQAAATQLPAPVRRNQPWIRKFGSVQKAMDPPS